MTKVKPSLIVTFWRERKSPITSRPNVTSVGESVSLCIYGYMCTNLVYSYTHTYTHARTHAHAHTHTHTHTHTNTNTNTRTHAYAHTCTHTHARTHANTHAHAHIYMYATIILVFGLTRRLLH